MTTSQPYDFDRLDQLAQRLMDGDGAALGELHDELAPALHALALTRAGNAAGADRAVEAVLKELWHGRALLSDGARVWLPRLFVRCAELATPPRGPGHAG